MFITASKLYDYIKCPHRIWRDKYGPQEERDPEVNPFLKLLWESGVQHEKKIIQNIGEFVDLSDVAPEERFKRTMAEMKNGTSLIYQGVITHKNMRGIPDLLKKVSGGLYIPIDIKSGKGLEGEDELKPDSGKLKKHYAVQLCLYVEILKQLGYAEENKGIIIDVAGKEVEYILDTQQGPKNTSTYWELYKKTKEDVELLLANKKQNTPVLSGTCKLCPWYISCKKWCKEKEDLTNIFCLSRKKRDVINDDLNVKTLKELADLNIEDALDKKKKNTGFLKGWAETSLVKFSNRAKILTYTKTPVIQRNINLPKVSTELFFDIEDDPTQDFVYLHGVYERKNGKERFISFLAIENVSAEEKNAWQSFWDYIKSLPQGDYAVYYYSHHERTTYKRLKEKYFDVISEEYFDGFFESPNVIDLYKIVFTSTNWPLSSYSIKEIATYLGFKWRDESPSGALSIKWYNDYLKNKNPDILKRILEYNEDDCKAMMVLKDYIEKNA